jgi:hypothetical protein
MTSANVKRLSGNLALLRSRTTLIADDYYEEKTEVWILGDKKGYTEFSSILKALPIGGQSLAVSYRKRFGMMLILIPAVATSCKAQKLRIIERIVFKSRKPQMELIICGNTKGFRQLAEIIDTLIINSLDKPEDHIHIDDWFDQWVVKRSIALNIRGPVTKWTQDALGEYDSMITSGGNHPLPENIKYLSKKSMPYKIPTYGESPLLTLYESDLKQLVDVKRLQRRRRKKGHR